MGDNECPVCYNEYEETRYEIGCGNKHTICHKCEWTMREMAPRLDGIRDLEDTYRPIICPMCRVVEKTAGERSMVSMKNELRQMYVEYFILRCRVTGDTTAVHAQRESRQLVPVPIQAPRAPVRHLKGKCSYDGIGCGTKGKTSLLCGNAITPGNQCTSFLCRRCRVTNTRCRTCVP
jgi:hypothetical protein